MKLLKKFFLYLLFISSSFYSTAQNQAEENKIKAKVRSFFNANKNVFLGQNPDAALLSEPESDDIKLNGKAELERSKQVAVKLKTQGLEYEKGQILDIRYDNLNITADKATLFATAVYKLHFKHKEGVPEFTQYDETRELTFSKQTNKWILVNQKLYIQGIPWNSEKDSIPTTTSPDKGQPTQTMGKVILSQNIEEDFYASKNERSNLIKGGPLVSEYIIEPSVTYNKIAAANYALAYATVSNSNNYRTYGNDCTNFVSQCLKAGGWIEAGGVFSRTSNSSWFYGSYESSTSYTWAGAENHYWFHQSTGRSTLATSVYNMSLGDVLQADFGPTPDNNINHTVIISKEDASGNDFVSYHSSNTLNKPMSQFISDCGPGTSFYGWRLKSIY